MNFDQDGAVEDLLANDEPNLDDPQYRFRERVNNMVKQGCTRDEAKEIVKTVIYTKESGKTCKCGNVSQFVIRGEIYCYGCRPVN